MLGPLAEHDCRLNFTLDEARILMLKAGGFIKEDEHIHIISVLNSTLQKQVEPVKEPTVTGA